jgi:CubicO group peptidase (beta-lactamase class C family)
MTKNTADDLTKFIPLKMKTYRVPGVSVALLEAGRRIWSRGFGVSDVETGLPVTQETVFEAASLGKPLLAFAAINLCASNVMTLDTPLSHYMAGQPVSESPLLEQVTLRRVLSHTTGFPNWRPKRFSPKPGLLTINFAPGEKFSYSGEGFAYLQQVIEHLTGQSLHDFANNLFLPLLMPSSSYVWHESYQPHLARGHNKRAKPVPWNRFKEANAAFSLYSTPSDYASFVQQVMQPGHSEMLTPQASLTDELSWGLGWGLWEQADKKSFWHWGDNGAYQSFVTASSAEGDGIVIMTNGQRGQSLCRDVTAMMLGVPHPAFAWLEQNFYGAKLA